MASPIPYETRLKATINDAKFDVSTPSSFGGVRANAPTDRTMLLHSIDTKRLLITNSFTGTCISKYLANT